MDDMDLSRCLHLVVRKEDVLCTRCMSSIPVHAGDGTPLGSMILAFRHLVRRHPPTGNCSPHDGDGL